MNQISPLLLRHVMSAAVASPPTGEREDSSEPDFLLTLGTATAANSGPDRASAADDGQVPASNPSETTLSQRQICTVRTWRNTLDFDAPPAQASTVLPGPRSDPAIPNPDMVMPAHAGIPGTPQTVLPPDAGQSLPGSDVITKRHAPPDPDSASEALASPVAVVAHSPAPTAQAAEPAGGETVVSAVPSIARSAADVPVSTPDDLPATKAMPLLAITAAATAPSASSTPPVHSTRWDEGTEITVTGADAEPASEIRLVSAREAQQPGSSPTPMAWPMTPAPPAASSAPVPASGEIPVSPAALPQSAPHPGTTTENSGFLPLPAQLPNRPTQTQDMAEQLPTADEGGAEAAAMERDIPIAQENPWTGTESWKGMPRTATAPVVASPAPATTARPRNPDSLRHSGAVSPEDTLAPAALARAPTPARTADPAVSALATTIIDTSDRRSQGVARASVIHSSEMAEIRTPIAAVTPARIVEAPIAAEKPSGSDGPGEPSAQVQKLFPETSRLPKAAPSALPTEIASSPVVGRSPAENVLRAIDAMMPGIDRSEPLRPSIGSGAAESAEAGSASDPRSAPPLGVALAATPAMKGTSADQSMAEADHVPGFRPDLAPAGPEPALRGDPIARVAFASQPMPRDPVEQIRPILTQLNTGTTEIRLSPEELGPLRMEVSTEGEKLIVVLSAERSETLELVRRNLDRLLSDLRNAGFSQIDLGFGRWSGGNAQEHSPSDDTAAQLAQGVEGEPAAAPAPISLIQRPDGGLYLRI